MATKTKPTKRNATEEALKAEAEKAEMIRLRKALVQIIMHDATDGRGIEEALLPPELAALDSFHPVVDATESLYWDWNQEGLNYRERFKLSDLKRLLPILMD